MKHLDRGTHHLPMLIGGSEQRSHCSSVYHAEHLAPIIPFPINEEGCSCHCPVLPGSHPRPGCTTIQCRVHGTRALAPQDNRSEYGLMPGVCENVESSGAVRPGDEHP